MGGQKNNPLVSGLSIRYLDERIGVICATRAIDQGDPLGRQVFPGFKNLEATEDPRGRLAFQIYGAKPFFKLFFDKVGLPLFQSDLGEGLFWHIASTNPLEELHTEGSRGRRHPLCYDSLDSGGRCCEAGLRSDRANRHYPGPKMVVRRLWTDK